MATPELGVKQVCPNCQAKFYDLNRRPAHCPKCAAEFDPEEALKSRRVRGRLPADYAADEAEDQVAEKKPEAEDEDEEVVAAPEIDEEGHEPILTPDDEDDAPADASEEPGMGATEGDDEVLEEEDDDAVPFIEDDEDDDSFEDEIVKPDDED